MSAAIRSPSASERSPSGTAVIDAKLITPSDSTRSSALMSSTSRAALASVPGFSTPSSSTMPKTNMFLAPNSSAIELFSTRTGWDDDNMFSGSVSTVTRRTSATSSTIVTISAPTRTSLGLVIPTSTMAD